MGVFFSAALSVGLPRLAVSQHPALWSPDFPHDTRLLACPAVAWPTSQVGILSRDRHACVVFGYNVVNYAISAVASAIPRKAANLGLFDRFTSAGGTRPDSVAASKAPDTICAPLSGSLVQLKDVADPVFAQGMLGPGLGIAGEGDVAYAPVSGVVTAVISTGHAVAIKADDGAEVLLHVGVDTVALRGRGFRTLVEKGEHVSAGDPLIMFDRALIRESGLDDTVIVTITNPDEMGAVSTACGQDVSAGEALLTMAC